MHIRLAKVDDFDAIWSFFEPIASTGDTYAYPQNITKDKAFELWMTLPRETYVCEVDDGIAGSFYLKTNAQGPGAHVANAGFMTDERKRGRGVATAMCEYAQSRAIELGYLAMQFNFVASTNEGAVRLWSSLGFEVVGKLPKAFKHPHQGYVDALVMYKQLKNY